MSEGPRGIKVLKGLSKWSIGDIRVHAQDLNGLNRGPNRVQRA